MRYPFVLFDVGDTLVAPRQSYGAVYAETLAGLGLELPAGRLDGAIRQAADELRRQIPPGTDRFAHFAGGENEFWLRFAQRSIGLAAGRPIDSDFAREALMHLRAAFKKPSIWAVFEEVPPMLRALRDLGCRLGIVSNWDSRLPQLLRRLELAHYFEVTGVSHLEGVEKPDPAFFLRILERLSASADRTLHVGNQPDEDLAGARAAGVECLLVDRRGELDRSHRAVKNLRDLPSLVG